MGNSILTQDNEIWLGHKKGLARLSQTEFDRPGKSPLEFYTLLDGYSNESVRKIIEDSAGMLWSVGNKDVIGINKERIEQNSTKPKTHLRKLIQADQAYQLNHKPDLKFSYQENYIGFEFNAIDVNKSHKLEYRHQLLGYESNWSNPSVATSTFYPNLPHGSYTFEVASRLVNGEWGEPAQYSFRITPPWWESKIAYIIYITLGLLAMTWIWRDQLNRIRVKNQIEKELLEAEKIREIDEVKTRFFTNMSHEYRTPLTVILGMTEELKEDNLAKKLIKQSGQNLLRLVNQMLDFSKLEDGRLVLNLKQGEFVSYLQYLLESFQSLAEHKNITLHFESSIKALHMPFDEDKIQHIISNLLSNA